MQRLVDEPDRYCRQCHYPLVGLSEHRCPECGTPFDPRDPTTVDFHPRPQAVTPWKLDAAAIVVGGSAAALLGSSPGWACVGLAWFAIGALLISALSASQASCFRRAAWLVGVPGCIMVPALCGVNGGPALTLRVAAIALPVATLVWLALSVGMVVHMTLVMDMRRSWVRRRR